MSNQDISSVLIIYTGGTIGMHEDPETGSLKPLNFKEMQAFVPELEQFSIRIEAEALETPLDSSDVGVSTWIKLAEIIRDRYNQFDGFVVLHGTDTMAYTSSALSFMLQNLTKPVVITGSQLPIGKLRTDGRENLISAIEVAGSQGDNGITEVCVMFGSRLMRGNRTHKTDTEDFDGIQSANFPSLAQVGTNILYKRHLFASFDDEFTVHLKMERNVAILKLFPGITKGFVDRILGTPGLKGLILETYGAGNAPDKAWLHDLLAEAISNGLVVANVTQCTRGFVEQGKYGTSQGLAKCGVLGSADMTTEAALTKLMYLLGDELSPEEVRMRFEKDLFGERTSYSKLV